MKQLGFDYSVLDKDTAAHMKIHAERIRFFGAQTALGVAMIGTHLTEAKKRVGHGHFLKWIDAEFGMSERAARRFMEVHANVKTANLAEMTIDVSALYLIAARSMPEPVREEALRRAEAGEPISHALVKTVVTEYRKPEVVNTPVRELFDVAQATRAEARSLLPSPAAARRSAIETGAHTLDYNGTYQPPVSHADQERWKADLQRASALFSFLEWDEGSPVELAQIILRRGWRNRCEGVGRMREFLERFEEALDGA